MYRPRIDSTGESTRSDVVIWAECRGLEVGRAGLTEQKWVQIMPTKADQSLPTSVLRYQSILRLLTEPIHTDLLLQLLWKLRQEADKLKASVSALKGPCLKQ